MDEERVPQEGAEQDGMMVYIDPNVIHSMAAAAARKQAGASCAGCGSAGTKE